MTELRISVDVEETLYEAPTRWRLLGGQDKARHVVELCERNNIEPKNLLEVGAGDGAILSALSAANFCKSMHAVEISKSGVDVILNQKIPGLESCVTFDGYHVPFPDNSFDLVILSHVIEHVEFERALLREIARVSRFQIIEIPMDCNALHDPVYHFLGPSYGHINARSPDSMRFLLSTERMLVVDEMLGRYDYPVQHYDYFINNSRAETPEAEAAFRRDYEKNAKLFRNASRDDKIRLASYYTILCRLESPSEKAERALDAVKTCVDRGQIQASRLIFDFYISEEERDASALHIAEYALNKWPKAAIEYADKVSEGSENSGRARDIRELASQRMTETISVVSDEPSAAGSAASTLRTWTREAFRRARSVMRLVVRSIRKV